MHKALKLLENKDFIQKTAMENKISQLSFCMPVFESWQESDNYVRCLVSIDQPPDQLGQDKRGELLRAFELAVKQQLQFELVTVPLDNMLALMDDVSEDMKGYYQEVLDTSIPLDMLTALLLSDQFLAQKEKLDASASHDSNLTESPTSLKALVEDGIDSINPSHTHQSFSAEKTLSPSSMLFGKRVCTPDIPKTTVSHSSLQLKG